MRNTHNPASDTMSKPERGVEIAMAMRFAREASIRGFRNDKNRPTLTRVTHFPADRDGIKP